MSLSSSTVALLLGMSRHDEDNKSIHLTDEPCGGDLLLTPGAARVLLRIMRKAAVRTATDPGSDENADRLAS